MLKSGSHFGEIKFLSGRPRTASARSLNFAHVFYLERKSLMALLEKHPEEKVVSQRKNIDFLGILLSHKG